MHHTYHTHRDTERRRAREDLRLEAEVRRNYEYHTMDLQYVELLDAAQFAHAVPSTIDSAYHGNIYRGTDEVLVLLISSSHLTACTGADGPVAPCF